MALRDNIHERMIRLDPSWDIRSWCWVLGRHPDYDLPILVRPEIGSTDILLAWPERVLNPWRWVYRRRPAALAAAHAWLDAGCAGEPQGWQSHPGSGRRRIGLGESMVEVYDAG